MVLQVLREYKLYAKLSNYIFYQKKIHYLGHIISVEGITIDPENIEDIGGWKTPRNFIEVISFMGISGYYQRFIKRFFKTFKPNHFFTKEGREI